VARAVSKVDSRIYRTAYGAGALVIGLFAIGLGTFFALAGFGVVDAIRDANAPLWVVGFVGLAFALAGLLLVAHGARGVAARRRAAEILRLHGNRPWFADYPWDAEGIEDRPYARVANGLVGVALFAARSSTASRPSAASGTRCRRASGGA